MTPLETIIAERIKHDGTITLAAFMELALQHPTYGYYRTGTPLGCVGDFITAPEISQMFGEMIGLWSLNAWEQMGRPATFTLLELGAGRGTLMADLLRATRHASGFHDALHLSFLESNAHFRIEQQQKMAAFAPRHIADVADLPPLPSLIIANEFFDALPIHQYERGWRGWFERGVMLNPTPDPDQPFAFIECPVPLDILPTLPINAPVGTVIETCPTGEDIMATLTKHIVQHGGALLAIDYGTAEPTGTSSFQALHHHHYADPLTRVGQQDLTAHVDFSALAHVARKQGGIPAPLQTQGDFLAAWGITLRAERLKATATPDQAAAVDSALFRLTHPTAMGDLFKVLTVTGKPPHVAP